MLGHSVRRVGGIPPFAMIVYHTWGDIAYIRKQAVFLVVESIVVVGIHILIR